MAPGETGSSPTWGTPGKDQGTPTQQQPDSWGPRAQGVRTGQGAPAPNSLGTPRRDTGKETTVLFAFANQCGEQVLHLVAYRTSKQDAFPKSS